MGRRASSEAVQVQSIMLPARVSYLVHTLCQRVYLAVIKVCGGFVFAAAAAAAVQYCMLCIVSNSTS